MKISAQKLAQAIRKQCLECMCNSASEIVMCTYKNCSLYPFRLYGSKEQDFTLKR